jgi:hypothetical protein
MVEDLQQALLAVRLLLRLAVEIAPELRGTVDHRKVGSRIDPLEDRRCEIQAIVVLRLDRQAAGLGCLMERFCGANVTRAS